MADDRNRKLTGAVPVGAMPPAGIRRTTGAIPVGGLAPSQVPRDPRAAMVVPVRYRYQSIIDFVETQSINVSQTGMFIASAEALPTVGTVLDFEFVLADGFPLLRGKGEVVRVSARPPGVGVRFQELDEASRRLIDRIVEVNAQEGKRPLVPLDFDTASSGEFRAAGDAGVSFADRDLRVAITTATVAFFTNNPLLNIRLGGFVVPGPEDVPLGTVFSVTLEDAVGTTLFSGKGKVVAKHERRLGVRLTDAPKDVLVRLQAEVAKLVAAAPGK